MQPALLKKDKNNVKTFPKFMGGILLGLIFSQPVFSETLSLRDLYQTALKRNEMQAVFNSQQQAYDFAIKSMEAQKGFKLSATAGSKANFQQLSPGQDNTNSYANLDLTQPLLNNRSLNTAIQQTLSESYENKASFDADKQALFQSLSDSFFNAVRTKKEGDNLKQLRSLLEKRIAIMQRWVAIGKSPESDLLSIKLQINQLDLMIHKNKQDLDLYKKKLKFLSRLDAADFDLDETSIFNPKSKLSVDTFLKKLDNRPDIQALTYKLTQKKQALAFTESLNDPSLTGTLTGQYLHTSADRVNLQGSLTYTQTFLDNGYQDNAIEKAKEDIAQAELNLTSQKIQAKYGIETAISQYYFYQDQQKKYETLINTARRFSQQVMKDYELKLVSNLDVLKSLTNILEAQNQEIESNIQAQLAYIQLQLSVGELP